MRDNKAIAVLAGSVILGSGLAIALSISGGTGPRLDAAPFREAGRVLARQARGLLKPGGAVTVITRDTAAFENPASDVLLKSFRNELSKGGVKIDSVQALQIDPLRLVSVPSGDFVQYLRKATQGSVIVSFMGPPILTEAQKAQVGEMKASIVALCSGPMRDRADLRSLFSQGLLQAAVVSRKPSGTSPGRPRTDREAFEQQFVEVTSGNVSALSSSSSSPP
jgi:hypothetical protein